MNYPILTWLIAIIATSIGLFSLIHLNWIALHWPKAMASVTGNIQRTMRSTQNNTTQSYFAKLKFVTAAGEAYYVDGDSGQSKPYVVGEQIELVYKPGNPNHTMTLKLSHRLIFSGGFLFFGLICWALIFGFIGS